MPLVPTRLLNVALVLLFTAGRVKPLILGTILGTEPQRRAQPLFWTALPFVVLGAGLVSAWAAARLQKDTSRVVLGGLLGFYASFAAVLYF